MRYAVLALGLVLLAPAARSWSAQPAEGATPAGQHAGAFASAAVAADHHLASEAGAEILRAGGNAVDAAVATSFALSVVRPYSCGIGGGGFMVIHLKDHPRHGTLTTALNYREQAPAGVSPDFYLALEPDAATHGGRGVAVPGTVAGLLHALEEFGSGMSRDAVLAPAIRLAEEGFTVDAHYAASAAEVIAWIRKDEPARSARFAFVWDRFLARGAIKPGDVIRLPEQAAALRLIAQRGRDGFYRGPVADAIVEAAAADGGVLTLADLASFRVARVDPLTLEFRGKTIHTMPPPSSGGLALAQTLAILDARLPDLRATPPRSPQAIHRVTEAAKHAFADRARWLGDPAFVDVPVARLLSPDYLRGLAATLLPDAVLPHERYGSIPAGEEGHAEPHRDGGTSHFSVVDAQGNAVACTETINLVFGSLRAAERFGFVLNNQMDDFATRPGLPNAFGLVQSARNAPAPGKRPLSSMTPLIALDPADHGRVVLVAGASGGPRIISSTLQAALNVLVHDMPAGDALAAPRFHHQWTPDVLLLEAGLADADGLVPALEAAGHRTRRSDAIGNVQIIRAARDGAGLDAACDPRKGGRPAGY